MNKYEVFIDTNIYDASNYKFENNQFSKLQRLIDKDYVSLLTNSVINGEVKSHIKSRINTAVKKINENLNDRIFVPFRDEKMYSEKVELFDKNKMQLFLENKFENFLLKCNATKIDINSIDVEKIMIDYFSMNPPFEESKRNEFKDAIAIQSIIKYADKMDSNNVLCVISGDKGFRKSFKSTEIKVFENLNSFIDYVTTIVDKQSTYLKECLQKSYIEDDINNQICKVVKNINYSTEYYMDEFDIIDIQSIEYYINYVDIINSSSAKVLISAKVEIQVDYSYTNEEQSCFDKEDWQYLWKVNIEKEEIHRVEFELSIDLDIYDFNIENYREEYYDGTVSVIGYSNEPKSIYLDEDTCIYSEIISSSDPFDEDMWGNKEYAYGICPDCNESIGINNDGGNGFCANCAMNH